MSNYFYDLPIELQEKIYFEIHKKNMQLLNKNSQKYIFINKIIKNPKSQDFVNISPVFWCK